MTGCVLIYALTATSNPRTYDQTGTTQCLTPVVSDEHQIKEVYSTKVHTSTAFVQHCFQAFTFWDSSPNASQLGCWWRHVTEYSIHTSLAEYPCEVVTNLTWLFTLKKVRQKNIGPTLELVSKSFQNLATDNRLSADWHWVINHSLFRTAQGSSLGNTCKLVAQLHNLSLHVINETITHNAEPVACSPLYKWKCLDIQILLLI